jgi:nucleotide-binding universal stress UspA family protein
VGEKSISMQAVLIATDFSDSSEHATHYGLSLAQSMGAAVLLVHVVEPIGDPAAEDPEIRQFHQDLIEKGRARLAAALQGFQGAASSQIELGHRLPTLLRIIEEQRPHLVVLGSRLRETRHVGTGLELLAHCPYPVLLVPFSSAS